MNQITYEFGGMNMRKQRVLSALVLSVCMLVTGTMSVLAKDTVGVDE